MIIDDKKTVNVDGTEYWTVHQFAALTNRSVGTIRQLIRNGNRVRKLKNINLGRKPLIPLSELFRFPFVSIGRSFNHGISVERFYMEGEELMRMEEYLKEDVHEPSADGGV